MTVDLEAALGVIHQATLADLGLLQAALDDRRLTLTHAAAATLHPGDPVTIADATPEFLNGLTGIIESVTADDVAGPTAAVLLDGPSTGALRFVGRPEYKVGSRVTRFTVSRIPLDCVIAHEAAPVSSVARAAWSRPADPTP